MELNNLKKTSKRTAKRIGRGLGSGKGKTGGRGMKGQKARGKIPTMFSGNIVPLYKRLPFRRGLGNNKVSEKAVIIKTSTLNKLKANTVIDLVSLKELKLIRDIESPVKILIDQELTVALTVNVPVSKNARSQIEKAGGKVGQLS